MISCIIGLPGSGKSTLLSYIGHRAVHNQSINFHGFHISTLDRKHFPKYDFVYSNFPCSGAYQLDFEMLGKANYRSCLILCDEIQLFADSRNFKDFSYLHRFWFSNHRKFKVDFCYCTQNFDHVDKRIRDITDKIYVIDRLPFNFIRVKEVLTDFNLATLGQKYSLSGIFNTSYFFAPRLYKFNDTYALMKDIDLLPVKLVSWDSLQISCSESNDTKEVVESC